MEANIHKGFLLLITCTSTMLLAKIQTFQDLPTITVLSWPFIRVAVSPKVITIAMLGRRLEKVVQQLLSI